MSEPDVIQRDGVWYVPRLWVQSCKDALDTACAEIDRLEAERVALMAVAQVVTAYPDCECPLCSAMRALPASVRAELEQKGDDA